MPAPSTISMQPSTTTLLSSTHASLESFFNPNGVAIIGSVDTGPYAQNRLHFYRAPVCYINPRGGDAGPVPVYKTLADAPDPLDLAIVKVGAERVAGVVEDCARRGVRNIVIFSNGFTEVGPNGARLERELAEVIRRTNVRVIGPNTNENVVQKWDVPAGHRGGLIGLITQSGFQGRAIVEGVAQGAGFTRWIPTGNEVDLDAADFIKYFSEDPETAAVACYIEGFRSGEKLRAALQIANQHRKPVVVLKIGASEEGVRMASSHTGHLAGSSAVIDGLFAQYGVTRVNDLDELLETANLFAKFPPDNGPRCALYAASGGTVTLMADLAGTFGVPAPKLTAHTQAEIAKILPPHFMISNPIDNGGGMMHSSPAEHRIRILELLADDPNIDIVVCGIGGSYPMLAGPFCSDILAWAKTARKPVVATWNTAVTECDAYRDLVASGVPIFRSFRGCFGALASYERFRRASKTFRARPSLSYALSRRQAEALAEAGVLSSGNAARLIADANINTAGERLVQSGKEARVAAESIGFPVALKLMSQDFPHKSDVGLLRLNVADGATAQSACEELLERAHALNDLARIDGVLVQEQVKAGVEMIVGLSRDAQFGPTITIGAGGIYAEILKDVAVRPLPVDADDIRQMIASLKIAPLLDGARGAKPADKESLVSLALSVAALGESAAGRLVELDLNPTIVLPEKAVAVDVLAVTENKAPVGTP